MCFLEFEAKPISVMLPRRQKQELFSTILFPSFPIPHHWELLTQCHLICHPNGSPHCEMHQRLRLRSRHNSKFTLNHPTSIASQTHGRLQTMFFFILSSADFENQHFQNPVHVSGELNCQKSCNSSKWIFYSCCLQTLHILC